MTTGLETLLRTWPACPKAAVAQRQHKAKVTMVVFIKIPSRRIEPAERRSPPKRPESRAKGDAYRTGRGNRHTKPQRRRFKLGDAGAGWGARICTYLETEGKYKSRR